MISNVVDFSSLAASFFDFQLQRQALVSLDPVSLLLTLMLHLNHLKPLKLNLIYFLKLHLINNVVILVVSFVISLIQTMKTIKRRSDMNGFSHSGCAISQIFHQVGVENLCAKI